MGFVDGICELLCAIGQAFIKRVNSSVTMIEVPVDRDCRHTAQSGVHQGLHVEHIIPPRLLLQLNRALKRPHGEEPSTFRRLDLVLNPVLEFTPGIRKGFVGLSGLIPPLPYVTLLTNLELLRLGMATLRGTLEEILKCLAKGPFRPGPVAPPLVGLGASDGNWGIPSAAACCSNDPKYPGPIVEQSFDRYFRCRNCQIISCGLSQIGIFTLVVSPPTQHPSMFIVS